MIRDAYQLDVVRAKKAKYKRPKFIQKTILFYPKTGDFAENKDIARQIRIDEIEPAIEKGIKVILDFNEVASATQSFIHALISNVIRVYGIESLDILHFKNCNERIKTIVLIVVDYVQDGINAGPE